MSKHVTEREFNEMMFTHEDYNALKSDIAALEATVKRVQWLLDNLEGFGTVSAKRLRKALLGKESEDE